MNEDPTRHQGERIASLEARTTADGQSIRDLWEAHKAERIKREECDDALEGRLNKAEVFMGPIALVLAMGSVLATIILGAVVSYVQNLMGKH